MHHVIDEKSPRESDAVKLSIILPAYNEEAIIHRIVSRLRNSFPEADIVVVDDKSDDETAVRAAQAGARVVRHNINMGNGAAIKTGARSALGEVFVFMDADGQHDDRDIPRLLEQIEAGYELVVGARTGDSQANWIRGLGNHLLNQFASILTGFKILDLTSGFRAARRSSFADFLYLLPNGYSYPTTSTMAYLRSGYPVGYVPIKTRPRVGRSKINLLRDGVRFLVIVMRVTTLYSPMRLFFPLSLLFFGLGLGRYLYYYFETNQFSNMSGVLFVTAVLIFLIGLISEQITALHVGLSRARGVAGRKPEETIETKSQ